MQHTFCVDVAIRYGVDAAIMIENFRFWIAKNQANGRHFYDGQWWTYNSVKAFADLFPYWTPKQIRRTLDKLVSDGVLIVGSYNNSAMDQTKWYTLKGQMHLPKRAIGIAQTGKSLTSTDSKPDTRASASPPGFDRFWNTWPKSIRKGGKSNCLAKWNKAKLEAEAESICKHVEGMKRSSDWVKNGGEFIPAPAVYLNGRRWDGADGQAPANDIWAGSL